MYPGSLPYAISLIAISVLTGGIATYAFSRSQQAGAITFGWLTTGMTLWSFLYTLEILAPTLSSKILAAKLEYIGFTSTPVFWLLFALEYTGHKDWLTPTKRIALVTLPTLTFGLTLTNEFHHLIWRETSLDPQGYPSLIIVSHGIWFWIHTAYSYCLILAGVALYFISYFQAQHIFRTQRNLVIIGSIVPLAVNAFTLFTPIPLHGFDLTPFGFALSSVLSSIGFFRYSLLSLAPIATPLVMENLRDAVIVIDNSKRVVNMNPIARQWLGVGNEAIGQSVLNVLRPSNIVRQYWDTMEAQVQLEIGAGKQRRWLDTMISPLRNSSGKILGRVVVARDITNEHALLISEKRRARQMELLNQITNTALRMPDLRQALQVLADQLSLLLEADGAFITLWDEAEQRVIPATAYGEFRETYKNMKLEPGENTMTASVLREGRPLAAEDVFNTPYMNPRLADDVPTQSMLGLPLIANDKKMGAALISFNQRHQFTTEEIAIGEQAAAQIALAVFKARLLDISLRQVNQLELLAEVGRQIADSLDEKEILDRTIEAIVDRFGYAEVAISLLINDDILEATVISGTEDFGFHSGYRQKMGKGIIGHVAKTRKYHVSNDVSKDPYYYSTAERNGSALCVPMLDKNDLLGTIYVETIKQNYFQPDDIQTLQTLANQVATSLQKRRLYARAQEHLTSMTTLQSISQAVTSSLELDKVFKIVVQLLKENFGYTYVSIYLLDGEVLRLGAQAGYPEELIIYDIPVNSGVIGRTIRERQAQFIRDVKVDPNFLRASHEVESEICVPLLKEDIVLGVLNIESDSSLLPLTEKDVELLTSFAGPVAMAIDNARLHAEITSLALTDGMTSLVNRRAFDQVLELEIVRAARYAHPLSLIMLDIDSFKVYNDTYGHPAGDERIKAIASILLTNVRDPDVAARYGGEEFVIILTHTTKAGAMMLAERLRESAEALSPEKSISGTPIAGYTLSLGVASFPEDGTTSSEILFAADNAEMAAKRLGKNRVCASGTSKERAL